MRTFAQQQKHCQRKSSTNITNQSRSASPLTAETHPLLHLQRTIGNQAVLRSLQASAEGLRVGSDMKLTVNAPGDAYEQEADRIADQVMATPAHHCVSDAPPHIQRLAGQQIGNVDAVPDSVDRVLGGSGSPLEPTVRQEMEQRFGHDFSRVRVHSGAAAEQSARDVNAKAYTMGHNIVFGEGQYSPHSATGRHLLAHELTHTIQQSSSSPATISRKDRTSIESGNTALKPKITLQRSPVLARAPDPDTDRRVASLAKTTIDELDDDQNSKVLISAVIAAARLSQLPAFAAILRATKHRTYGDYFVFLLSQFQDDLSTKSTVGILGLFADAGVDISNLNSSLDPLAAVAKFKSLVKRFKTMLDSGGLSEEDVQPVRLAIADAQTALRAIEGDSAKPGVSVKQAGGVGVAAAAGWAWRAAGVLAADDVTGIGVADDIALPFVIVAAAALSAIALFSGSSRQILNYGPAMEKVQAALRAMTAVLGVSIILMAENVADTGIMGEVYDLIAAATAAGTALTICAALDTLMAAAKQSGDTARVQKIKATQKAKGCRHSRHR